MESTSQKKFFCPACQTELVPGKDQVFETLDEHVSCVEDEDIPSRPVVICPNADCVAHKDGCFWDNWYGDGPYSKVLHQDEVWIDSNSAPFNSPARAAYFQINYDKEDKVVKLGKKLKLQFKIKYRSNEFGDKCGRRINFNIIWKGTYYQSGIRMLIFSIKHYYKERKYKKTAAQELVDHSKWRNAEWWRRAAALWVKTFHSSELRRETR